MSGSLHPSAWRQRAVRWLQDNLPWGASQEQQITSLALLLTDACVQGQACRDEAITQPSGARTRLTLDVSQELYQTLSALADELKVSRAEVLRRGLALVSINSDARDKGQFLSLSDADDKVVTRILLT